MQLNFGFVALLCACMPLPGADIALTVPSGAPLRLYITGRLPKRLGASVQGKILDPVFAFDKEVIPAGSSVSGTVTRLTPVPKMDRVRALLNGDFTPLHNAQVEFNSLVLPDGRALPLHTTATPNLNSLYIEPSKKKRKARAPVQNGGVLGTARQTVREQINGAVNARTYGIAEIIRGPDKKERVVDLLWTKVPWHPQYLRRGTRFDAVVSEPLQFGTEPVNPPDLAQLGSQPAAGSLARVRLLTPLDSVSARQGESVEAVVTAPLYTADRQLSLPEGTRLTGSVTAVKKARSFHRTGQLRFNFQRVDLPVEIAGIRPAPPLTTSAALDSAEGNSTAPLKVDSEGGVKAEEPKTRFIAPLIALVLAGRAADNDEGRHAAASASASPESNVAGRTLGGISGFGLVGMGIAQSSKYVGMAFGYYGLAWSVYSSLIAKGAEVRFDRNAMMDIRFGARPK